MRTRTRGKWKCGGVCKRMLESSDVRNLTKCGKTVCNDCFPRHKICQRGKCMAGSQAASHGHENATGD